MNIEDLTIAQARKLAAMFGGGPGNKKCTTPHHLVGQFVLVRTRDAGVHMGTLESVANRRVVLKDARRLWRWRGANTLNEVATRGVSNEYTRISEPAPSVTLLEACEILAVSSEARKTLEVSQWPS